ncbi:hypothetical protein P0W64_18415 [Tsukamurella sp. 8F]|uniref:hypothetical protein n=1 Tax=unclassified Tsukamurella TaxID=2633480 RepID=UPI0023B8EFE6|nr:MULTISPECIES: hypothetical protein [unclassified Tsukamurella]MDF0531517.1 hypothetical protein [Tsukamurella sp. 8J]MDF0588761.1 hypothetical protein [Tsukamurella sp. 8F]
MSTQHLVDDAGRALGGAYRRTKAVIPQRTAVTSAIYAGTLAAGVCGVVYLFGQHTSGEEVSTVSSIAVGDCVTMSGGHPVKSACEGSAITFSVAEKFPGRTACTQPAYARTEADGSSLCLVPDLTVGTCYAVGGTSVATTDIKPVTCPTPLSNRSGTVVQVTQRASGGPLDCGTATALNYTQPKRVGYCVQPLT